MRNTYLGKKLDQLVSIYLGIDRRYTEYLDTYWASVQILYEARAGNVKEVILAFRRAQKNIPSSSNIAKEPVESALFATLEFFGEPLAEKEQKMAEKVRNGYWTQLLFKAP